MGEVVLLAGTSREADVYRRVRGIRYANFNPTPAQLKTCDVIIELPDFATRRDRFNLEQARDSRINFGFPVQYALDADWTPPPKPEPEPEPASVTPEELMVYQLDMEDPVTIGLLKERLNEVGLTLKKLPAKGKPQGEVPHVDAPVEF